MARRSPPPRPNRTTPKTGSLPDRLLVPHAITSEERLGTNRVDPAHTALRNLRPADAALGRSFILNLRGGWDRSRSEATIQTYAHALAKWAAFVGELGLPSLLVPTREHALEWAATLKAHQAAATAEVYIGAVRLFYVWLADEGEIARTANPFDRIVAPRRPARVNEPLTPEEIEQIFSSQSTTGTIGLRNRALFMCLLDSGLRLAELAAMDVADIDWKHGHVKVLGKGSKERVVRLGATTLAAIDRYLRTRARVRDVPWLWDSRTGGRLSHEGIYHLHEQIGKALGIHLHPHRWRHTNAQSLLDAGMDRESVRQLLGHSSEQTLRIYTSATDRRRALEQHARHSPVDNLRKGRRR